MKATLKVHRQRPLRRSQRQHKKKQKLKTLVWGDVDTTMHDSSTKCTLRCLSTSSSRYYLHHSKLTANKHNRLQRKHSWTTEKVPAAIQPVTDSCYQAKRCIPCFFCASCTNPLPPHPSSNLGSLQCLVTLLKTILNLILCSEVGLNIY
jgi:hypothetical protein